MDPDDRPSSPAAATGSGSGAGWTESTGSTNGLAVASLILGIAWLCGAGSLLAVIFGHVALAQIKRTGAAGRGLALAGLVLGYLGIVLCLIAGAAVILLARSGDDTAMSLI